MPFNKFYARSLQLTDRTVMAPMRNDARLDAPFLSTYYVPSVKGYTNYPALAA